MICRQPGKYPKEALLYTKALQFSCFLLLDLLSSIQNFTNPFTALHLGGTITFPYSEVKETESGLKVE